MSDVAELVHGEAAELSWTRRRRSLIGGSIGNLVEGYDWLVYSTFSLYFAHIFFPDSDRTVQLLNTAAVFSVGYIMRPIGAVLLGWFADRQGRKAALIVSLFMMCFGSLMIAVTPGYGSIGIGAPVILVIARMLQGLSMGGEYGASAAYLTEMSPPARRGFFVSFHYVTLLGGQLLSILALVLLQFVLLTPEQLDSWGWRIPFVIGAALAIVAGLLRRNIDESPAFLRQVRPQRVNPLVVFLRHPVAILRVAGLTIGGTVATNTFSSYVPKFLVNTVGISRADSTWISAISIVAFMAMQPLVGALSDRVGRKPVLVTFGLLGGLFVVPILKALEGAHAPSNALIIVLAGLAITSFFTAVSAVVKAELFPPEARAVGIGVPYAIIIALLGGTSEYIALLFKRSGMESGFYYWVAGCILFSLVFYVTLPETRPVARTASNVIEGA
jgi:MHS family alpha-ketoglutarate permease-like MFS transporter